MGLEDIIQNDNKDDKEDSNDVLSEFTYSSEVSNDDDEDLDNFENTAYSEIGCYVKPNLHKFSKTYMITSSDVNEVIRIGNITCSKTTFSMFYSIMYLK